MKKTKKIFLSIFGVIFIILVVVSIHIYRNIHVDSALLDYIEDMESKEDTPKLIKIFSNRWNPWLYREIAFVQMGTVIKDPAAVEPLIKILENRWESPRAREEAAFTLGCIGDERAIGPLIMALNYGRGWKYTALKSLTFIEVKDKRVCEVAKKLLNDESNVIRDLAVIALGVAGGEDEVDLLIEKLKNGRESERWNAANALGKIEDKRAVEPLIEILANETEDSVKGACCKALGKIEDKRAVEPLIRVLKDVNSMSQDEAAEALAIIGDRRAIEPLEQMIKLEKSDWWRNKLKESYKKLKGHEYKEGSK